MIYLYIYLLACLLIYLLISFLPSFLPSSLPPSLPSFLPSIHQLYPTSTLSACCPNEKLGMLPVSPKQELEESPFRHFFCLPHFLVWAGGFYSALSSIYGRHYGNLRTHHYVIPQVPRSKQAAFLSTFHFPHACLCCLVISSYNREGLGGMGLLYFHGFLKN